MFCVIALRLAFVSLRVNTSEQETFYRQVEDSLFIVSPEEEEASDLKDLNVASLVSSWFFFCTLANFALCIYCHWLRRNLRALQDNDQDELDCCDDEEQFHDASEEELEKELESVFFFDALDCLDDLELQEQVQTASEEFTALGALAKIFAFSIFYAICLFYSFSYFNTFRSFWAFYFSFSYCALKCFYETYLSKLRGNHSSNSFDCCEGIERLNVASTDASDAQDLPHEIPDTDALIIPSSPSEERKHCSVSCEELNESRVIIHSSPAPAPAASETENAIAVSNHLPEADTTVVPLRGILRTSVQTSSYMSTNKSVFFNLLMNQMIKYDKKTGYFIRNFGDEILRIDRDGDVWMEDLDSNESDFESEGVVNEMELNHFIEPESGADNAPNMESNDSRPEYGSHFYVDTMGRTRRYSCRIRRRCIQN